jgi:hypothetical protein
MAALQSEHAAWDTDKTWKLLAKIIRAWETTPMRAWQRSGVGHFDSVSIPSVAAHHYFERLLSVTSCDDRDSVAILCWIYLMRMKSMMPAAFISPWTIHRLLAACTLLAMKFLCDGQVPVPPFARLAGLPVGELCNLELLILKRFDWRVAVFATEVQAAVAWLRSRSDADRGAVQLHYCDRKKGEALSRGRCSCAMLICITSLVCYAKLVR